jgi:hypothetical protein
LIAAINWRFDGDHRCRLRCIAGGLPCFGFNHFAPNNALHILHNEWAAGQIYGAGIMPKRIKFFLHPCHRFGVVVFP